VCLVNLLGLGLLSSYRHTQSRCPLGLVAVFDLHLHLPGKDGQAASVPSSVYC
jgi:hypothetical protein